MAEASTTLAFPQIAATLAPSFVIATAARRTAIKEVKRQMQAQGHRRVCLTLSEKDNSVPGRRQTATLASSDAANPCVPVQKLRVVSLSPTLAGRDLTYSRLGQIL